MFPQQLWVIMWECLSGGMLWGQRGGLNELTGFVFVVVLT